MTDEFGNDERDIRLVAIAAHARGDYEAERLALDRLAVMERDAREEAAYNQACGDEITANMPPTWATDRGIIRQREQPQPKLKGKEKKMKVRVNFTVEFDVEQYRNLICVGHDTEATIRSRIQNQAMDAIVYYLGDQGVEASAIHNN